MFAKRYTPLSRLHELKYDDRLRRTVEAVGNSKELVRDSRRLKAASEELIAVSKTLRRKKRA